MSISTMPKTNTKKLLVVTMGAILGLTACQKPSETNTPAPTEKTASTTTATASMTATSPIGEKISVYTSTNVWGAIAKAVGGDHVDVIIAVNDPTQDPHDYQASANDKLNISKAKVMLVNGGGYDEWTTVIANSLPTKPTIIDAVAVSGLQPAEADHADEHDHEHEHDKHEQQAEHDKDHANEAELTKGNVEPAKETEAGHDHHHHHGEFNEHVFYSLDTAKKVAQAVAEQLSKADPTHQADYANNAKTFNQEIDRLKAKAQAIGKDKNLTAFATEPVVGYLLADMGIKDVTPESYVEQSETDAGVSVKTLSDSTNLLNNGQVKLLLVNAQTEDATSKKLVAIAQSKQIPVVQTYETFPQGVDSYIQFMEKTIDDIAKATTKP
ncbi:MULTISPECIES: metal ABC transporter solute-binding protein, Zn/Mn family [unclassified Moraxella]|uniref:metal ABC transporter solute-binding protein, Zn/Mn family n=1 Tax=unclassified Moraxella TaxID=2685852 RepID=UPI003AF4C825